MRSENLDMDCCNPCSQRKSASWQHAQQGAKSALTAPGRSASRDLREEMNRAKEEILSSARGRLTQRLSWVLRNGERSLESLLGLGNGTIRLP